MPDSDLLAGRYALGGVLGRGGMAVVRDGWDSLLQRPVAVKLLHSMHVGQSDALRRFTDEARAAASLSHPNIVAVHDFGEHHGEPFIVMERLPGDTLADLMAQGPVPAHRVRTVLDQVLAALQTAHAAGVLHRDIKPANILLASDGVKVADFGIAKTGGAAHTATGQIVGTMGYLSPERILGSSASVADDLYAVGIVGYEALLGQPAYPQDNPAAVALAITNSSLPPVATRCVGVDAATAEAIDRAVARDPRQRFESAAHMRAALTGNRDAPAVGAAAAGVRRPPTRVLDQPLWPPTAVGAAPVAETRSRRGAYVFAAAVLGAFAVAALALAMDPFGAPSVPESVSTSSSAPPPSPSPSSTVTTPPPSTSVPPPEPPPKEPKGDKKDEDHPGRGNGGQGNGGGNGRSG